jgi:hypothetical protein
MPMTGLMSSAKTLPLMNADDTDCEESGKAFTATGAKVSNGKESGKAKSTSATDDISEMQVALKNDCRNRSLQNGLLRLSPGAFSFWAFAAAPVLGNDVPGNGAVKTGYGQEIENRQENAVPPENPDNRIDCFESRGTEQR